MNLFLSFLTRLKASIQLTEGLRLGSLGHSNQYWTSSVAVSRTLMAMEAASAPPPQSGPVSIPTILVRSTAGMASPEPSASPAPPSEESWGSKRRRRSSWDRRTSYRNESSVMVTEERRWKGAPEMLSEDALLERILEGIFDPDLTTGWPHFITIVHAFFPCRLEHTMLVMTQMQAYLN